MFEENDGYFVNHTRSAYPRFNTLERRLWTFQNWPIGLNQTKSDMAESGFWYTNQKDIVTCFHCGVVLSDFEKTDIPMIEHAKHSKDCYFLQTKLPQEFIDEIQALKGLETKRVNNEQLLSKYEEYSQKDLKLECNVCLIRQKNILFFPCRHIVCCGECTFSIKYSPVCRKEISKIMNIYLS